MSEAGISHTEIGKFLAEEVIPLVIEYGDLLDLNGELPPGEYPIELRIILKVDPDRSMVACYCNTKTGRMRCSDGRDGGGCP